MSLTYLSEFAGVGGDSEGARRVEGLTPIFAANHNKDAIESHAANHPGVEHWLGDVQNAGGTPTFPHADIAWHSPACPDWTTAKGVKRTFDQQNQMSLWDTRSPEEIATDQAAQRSRALMEEVVIYLRAWHRRGKLIRAGVVENVVECRKWADWERWLNEIKALGYHVHLIALNSSHALAPTNRRCPQSRDRLYLAYWHQSLARTPHWDRWLRPVAWCPTCQEQVRALQTFKDLTADMGKYRAQYVYRCPRTQCRNSIVEPVVLPAGAIIDFTDPGTPIGERERPISTKTLARIDKGMREHWAPLLTPAGGSWREDAVPLSAPMSTRLTRECDGIALPPYITPLRDHVDLNRAYTTGKAPTGHDRIPPLLVQYYGNGYAYPTAGPLGALTTKDRYGLASAPTVTDQREQRPFSLDEVLFRMLKVSEIQAAMAFPDDYLLTPPSKRIKVRLLGNAVTPNCAEVILSALVEAATGEYRPSGWDLYEDSGFNYWDLAA